MDTPYRVEERMTTVNSGGVTSRYVTAYAIVRTGEDDLCRGDDIVFMHRLVDLLNADEHTNEGR